MIIKFGKRKIDHLLLETLIEGACVSPSDNLASQLNKITNEAVLNLGQQDLDLISIRNLFRICINQKNKKYILVLL